MRAIFVRVDAWAGRWPFLLWVATGARLLLAGVFGVAGVLKLGDPAETVRSVRAYKLLPEWLAVPFGHALPPLELAVAVVLVLGVALRLAAGVTAVLMTLFVAGISSAAARGLRIDCGCFGDGGPTDHPQYAQELFRDSGLLLLAVFLVVLGRSRLALDPPLPEVPAPTATSGGSRKQRHEQARLRAAYERSLRRHRGYELGASGLMLVAVLVGVVVGHASLPKPGAPVPPGTTSRGGVLVGSASAPHHLLVYEDPQCPVCAQFERVNGGLLRQAVADGRVQVEYRMRIFLGPESVRAVAALGAAVTSGSFEALREQLFQDQPAEGTGGFTLDDLVARGRSVGITDPAYEKAVRDQRYATWARRVDNWASQDGNVGTPDLVLDGHRLSLRTSMSTAQLAQLLA